MKKFNTSEFLLETLNITQILKEYSNHLEYNSESVWKIENKYLNKWMHSKLKEEICHPKKGFLYIWDTLQNWGLKIFGDRFAF